MKQFKKGDKVRTHFNGVLVEGVVESVGTGFQCEAHQAWIRYSMVDEQVRVVDLDKLELLKPEEGPAIENARAWYASIKEMVENLSKAEEAQHYDELDEITDQINDSVLGVAVRSGWHAPGITGYSVEYEILLTTGGPGLRITGSLIGCGEPDTADLEWLDWGTPWTEIQIEDEQEENLLKFARQFYFEE